MESHTHTGSKGWRETFMNTKTNKAGVAVFTPDRRDFQTRDVTRDKEGSGEPFLGISPEKPKTLNRKDRCTHMVIAALFTTAETWKRPACGQQRNGGRGGGACSRRTATRP